MKIISWNVNGLRSVVRKGFKDFLDQSNADFVCLQEIKSDPISIYSGLFDNKKYNEHFNSAVKKGYSGTAIFTNKIPITLSKIIGLKRFEDEGRFIQLNFKNFILINVYMPHGGRDKKNLDYKLECYKKLLDYLNNIKDQNIIIVGDFNIGHTELDLARPKGNIKNIMFTPEERKVLDNLKELGFVDSFREFNKDGGNYTWWPYRIGLRERNIGWRLDYIFVSKSLQPKLLNASILKDTFGSDHCPVSIDLDLSI